MEPTSHAPHQIPIFIDGERFEVKAEPTTAATLLGLVSKSGADWYLVLKRGRHQTEFRGDEEIELEAGEKFLSVFTGPTPVS